MDIKPAPTQTLTINPATPIANFAMQYQKAIDKGIPNIVDVQERAKTNILTVLTANRDRLQTKVDELNAQIDQLNGLSPTMAKTVKQ